MNKNLTTSSVGMTSPNKTIKEETVNKSSQSEPADIHFDSISSNSENYSMEKVQNIDSTLKTGSIGNSPGPIIQYGNLTDDNQILENQNNTSSNEDDDEEIEQDLQDLKDKIVMIDENQKQ